MNHEPENRRGNQRGMQSNKCVLMLCKVLCVRAKVLILCDEVKFGPSLPNARPSLSAAADRTLFTSRKPKCPPAYRDGELHSNRLEEAAHSVYSAPVTLNHVRKPGDCSACWEVRL